MGRGWGGGPPTRSAAGAARMFTYVGLSSLYLAPMLTLCSPMLAVEMLSPIAVTETTEVGTG